MTYVEWLRVRGALKWTAIVLGILFLCVLGLRIYVFSRGDVMSYISDIQNQSNSKVTESVLPDGTKRTVIDDPKGHVRVTMDDYGYAGKHIEIIDKSSKDNPKEHSVNMGSLDVEQLSTGDGERIDIDTNQPAPFVFYAAFAAAVALIVATLLAAPFARENDGHLEIALTKPISRIALALSTVGVDLAGIFGAWLLTVVVMLAGQMLFETPHITFGLNDLTGAMLGLLGAFAWYAMLCAATASLKRVSGVVLGLSWPVAIIVLTLGNSDLGTNPIFAAIHAGAKFIGYVMPFTYLHFGAPVMINGNPTGSLAFSAGPEGAALSAMLIVYIALAVFQWRRVEA